jgi:hypothetical protein
MDEELKIVKDELPLLVCNTTAAKEHVSKAEQKIQTIKEHTRGIIGTLSFEYIPQRVKMKFIYFVVLWINSFPVKTRVSGVYSPCKLLVQWCLDYKKHCQVLPGTYCKVHNEPEPSNTMTVCTHNCIACRLMGNLQGSVKFYCLKSGASSNNVCSLPCPCRMESLKKLIQSDSAKSKDMSSVSSTDQENHMSGLMSSWKTIQISRGC